MANTKAKYIDDPIYKIYPDYPVLILDNFEWSESEIKDSMHFHYYLEIGRCNQGEGTIVSKYAECTYRAGDITVIPPNFLHATRNGGGTASWSYLFIDLDHLLEFFRFPSSRNRDRLTEVYNMGFKIIKRENAAKIERILEEIHLLNEMKQGMYKMQIITCLLQIIMEVSNLVCSEPVQEENNGEEIQILPAVDYIYAHYMDQIKVQQLAEMCHFSESYFRKVFQRSKGLAPLDYLNCIRIRAAARMLLQTNLPIRVISEKCGYQAVSSFERNFMKRMGMLPGKWREEQMKNGIDYREKHRNKPK